MRRRSALLVIDVQRDFCPGGALPVKKADEIFESVNRLITKFDNEELPIVFTRDWHPPNHCSFESQGGVWPPHCIKNTRGAGFHPSLIIPRSAMIVSKATTRDSEAYSGFQGTSLTELLKSAKVEGLFIVGLATEYCVKNTVLDGISNQFRVYIVRDCVRGVNLRRTDSANAFRSMIATGAKCVTSGKIIKET